MRVESSTKSWEVNNVEELVAALVWRNGKGGALFHLSVDEQLFPGLTIRVTNDLADVHYFPFDGHPGFRCMGGQGLPKDGMTTFVYDGCDPSSGEECLNWFVVPFATVLEIAKVFLRTGERDESVEWFEL